MLLTGLLLCSTFSFAQQATVSIPVGIGKPCGGSAANDSLKYYNYNSTTNVLTHRSNCKPNLSPPGFSSTFATISFNPYDGYLYFSQIARVGAVYNTSIFKWLPTVCPSLPAPALPVYQTYVNQFVAGVEFDPATGLGYQINFVGAGPYTMELQQVNFATGVLGASQTVDFGGRFIYKQNGDVVMTPGGQMLAVYDNKYITINWKDYNTATPLVATFIDTLGFGAGNNLVGLSYSNGKLVGSIQGGACFYRELDILTGAQSTITYSAGGTLFASADMTNIPSGIGAAKKLISATENPIGSKTYDIVYEVVIKNYGGTPITNVQGYDTLNKINGAGNAISGSITSFSAPAGITQNAAYNGRTAGNFNLLTPGSTLSNIPGQNTITLRISCRVSNINPGIVYNNQAVVFGTGLLGDALSDSSTNGSNPDLNLNDKPDDVGESQPTPLLIIIVPQTPPCIALTNVLYNQNFGTGTGLSTIIPPPTVAAGVTLPTGTTSYTGSVTAPIPVETYSITNIAQNADNAHWLNLSDNTIDVNGRMMVVNADVSNTIIYRASFIYSLCAAQQYSLSFYSAFIGNSAYQTVCNAFGGFQYPKIKMRIRDGSSGGIITEVSTTSITNTSWQQYGLKFVLPVSYSNVIIELINDAPGGCGNDLAIDDIQFGTCDALPSVNVNNVADGCLGGSTTFTSALSDPSALPGTKDYQWQVATALGGPYTDISGSNSATFTINPITAADTGKFYRVIVAATGNLGNVYCRYTSPGIKLSGKTMSVAAISVNTNKNNICTGISVDLNLTGGTLGTNATWKWYSGACGTTLAGSGNTLTVTPNVTTTYWVRAEGDCNITTCQQITITVVCDIDKDDDGIPDYVESYMPAALLDGDGDGITNAFDYDYAGYIDINNDYINDNFQADGDIDNDGIANYQDTNFPGRLDINTDGKDDRFDMDLDGIINMLDLDSDNDGVPDVVEAGGVDAGGDARIDGYTDTDNDGLSQNVDANNTGARLSGAGLGAVDYDGDSKANAIDRDSDNDGIPDVLEVTGPDGNNDGIINGFVDANSDGIADNRLNASALLRTGTDINNDGRADSYPNKNFDNDNMPNVYDVDSDMDGIIDVIEAGFPDTDFDGFIDGALGSDGWSDAVDAMSSPLTLANTDTRGNPNYIDIDSDDDGIPDNVEGMTTASYLFPVYLDDDKDGLDNSYDNIVGFGGRGVFLSDKDIDGIPDYRDLDTDSDGQPDIKEGNDFNLNGNATDDNTTLTLLDTDGDGLDNRFDSLNSTTIIRGTSYRMGNGGSLIGDPAPGSRTVVQKTSPVATDRDWRSVGYVLYVQLLDFRGTIQNNAVSLDWGIVTPFDLDRFEIERSIDNIRFDKIKSLTGPVDLNELRHFASIDNISDIGNEFIYYKLKVITTNGQIKYSNVVAVKKSLSELPVIVFPNPASDKFTVRFTSEKEGEATIRLFDKVGKIVLTKKQNTRKGINEFIVYNLSQYAMGVYSLQFSQPNESVTVKLIIQRRN